MHPLYMSGLSSPWRMLCFISTGHWRDRRRASSWFLCLPSDLFSGLRSGGASSQRVSAVHVLVASLWLVLWASLLVSPVACRWCSWGACDGGFGTSSTLHTVLSCSALYIRSSDKRTSNHNISPEEAAACFATLRTTAHQASLSFTVSQSLLKLMSF